MITILLSKRFLLTIACVASINICFVQLSVTNSVTIKSLLPTINILDTFLTSASQPISVSNDSNWAGYIVASNLQNPQANVNQISALWTVPTVLNPSNDTFSAVWIGVGGYFDDTLIQVGTEQDSHQGQASYSAWLELLPDMAVTLDTLIISPGDQMNASIFLVDPLTDDGSIYIEDITTGDVYQNNFFYPASQLSAEWIVERPDIASRRSRGMLASLADVGQVEFVDCKATIGDIGGSINTFPAVQSVMYQSVQNSTKEGKTTRQSSPTKDGSSFSVETSASEIPELHYCTLAIAFIFSIGIATLLFFKKVKKR